MKRVDVAILGAGSAGLGALREVRKQTQSFVVINDGPWGTMCARVGCMPSKSLIEAAHAFHRRRAFAELGVSGAESLTIDVPAVLARVRRIRDTFVDETLRLTADVGYRAMSGRARLLGPNRVSVNGEELLADRIIVATGSRPIVPEAWLPFSDRLLTTDTLFEQTTLPKRMAVLGLGSVGVELAQALARLGGDVTAFDAKTKVAGLTDETVHTCLLGALRAELTVHLGDEAELLLEGDGLRVNAGGASVAVDRALVALGRRPNLDGLGLESLGVPLDEHGKPEVDPTTMQIGRLPVFLVGDVEGDRQVQHEAADEGHIAGLNACADAVKSFARRVPLSIVFTHPNIAMVGQRYAQLDPANIAVGEASFEKQGRARLALRASGRLRVYADKMSGRLLGAELCAPEGEHLAHLLALALERQCTVRDLLRAPFYHPTLEEGLREALRGAAKNLPGQDVFELAFTGSDARSTASHTETTLPS
jgi:dihydrolipoamide dehydrogenase